MSEANVPSRDSEHPTGAGANSTNSEAVSLPNVSPPEQPSSEDSWQTVNFPGTLPPAAIAAASQAPPTATPAAREAELLTLVRDLNQCNDHLIARVAHLEDALETSQLALQAEVARSQDQQSAVNRNEQIAANNQQIAQLVSELDFSNQALRRQQMLNETLQTELDNSRQHVAQLERECALIQQRYSEQSQALQQAETSCRDLRARLQRQQRYTMQFKVALEKCLDVPPSRQAAVPLETLPSRLEGANSPISMPKAQRIQPWSSAEATAADPNLAALIAGLTATPAAAEPPEPTAAFNSSANDPEAENQLWQDLERVIESSAQAEAERLAEPDDPETAIAASEPPTTAIEFTEPSPWGMPITLDRPPGPSGVSLEPEPPAPTPATANQAVSPLPPPPTAATLAPPILTTSATASTPSPLVYPLRPQKKRQSLAAVELPSFPKSQRPSL
ncbi:MAG: hypothetical protein ACTS3T_18785 [Almyronema sp.]